MATLSRPLLLRAGLVLVLAVVVLGVRTQVEHVPALLGWVQRRGGMAPFVFAAIYALAVPLLVPGSVLTLAAGALFGLWPAIPVSFGGAVVGSSLSFLIARYLARPRVEAWVARHPGLAALERAVKSEGTRMVFLLRLTPLVPFTPLNYVLGITSIRWRDTLLAAPAMLPGTFLYAYYGHVVGDVVAVAAGARPPRSPAHYVLLGAGLMAAAFVTWRVARMARRALKDADLDPAGEA